MIHSESKQGPVSGRRRHLGSLGRYGFDSVLQSPWQEVGTLRKKSSKAVLQRERKTSQILCDDQGFQADVDICRGGVRIATTAVPPVVVESVFSA